MNPFAYLACGFPILIVVAILWIGISNERKRARAQRVAFAFGEELTACVVQSPDLSEPSSASAPAQILLSVAGANQATPEQLSDLAARALRLTHAAPQSEAERETAEIVRDLQYRPTVRHQLPADFTGGLDVWACHVVIHQSKLPDGRLSGPYIRVKALPGPDGWVWMIETPAEPPENDAPCSGA